MKQNPAQFIHIEDIIDTKKPCVFLSPHLDDSILSCGSLINYLSSKTQVVVATVFTESRDHPKSLSIWNFLRLSGYKTSSSLFEDRRREDKEVITSFGAKPVHFGFTDGLYRLNSNSRLVYPLYSWAIRKGVVSQDDEHLIPQIAQKVQDLVSDKTLIFAPAAIGNHMDHLIVKKMCKQYFPQSIYWSDFPYNVRLGKFTTPDLSKYEEIVWDYCSDIKIEAIKKLKTQVGALFPNGEIPNVPERYFFQKH